MRKSSAPASPARGARSTRARSTWPATSRCSAVQSVRGSEPWTPGPDGSVESRLRRGRGRSTWPGRLSGVRRRRVRVDRRQVASRAGCGRRPPRIGDALGPRSGRGSPAPIALDAREGRRFGGEFDSVGDTDRTNLAAVDTRTGSATSWDVPVVGTVDVLARLLRSRLLSEGRSSRRGICDGTASQR
jgi:hypothetical protein